MKTIGGITLCWGFYAFAGLGAVVAQTDAVPPLPAGPLLRQPADFSTWEMTYAYAADQKNNSSTPAPQPPFRPGTFTSSPPRQVILTITQPLWHASVLNINGQKLEEWCVDSKRYFTAEGLPRVMQVDKLIPIPGTATPVPDVIPDFGAIGFPDMKWISPATYAGQKSINGHTCLVFVNDGVTAWVDLESRFPVQWQREGETRTFRQLAQPTEKVEPPPEVMKLVQADRHRVQISNIPVPKGG